MQSMTGFGRSEHATSNFTARVEITSVNRKQADIVFNLPRELGELEGDLHKTVLKSISRGRVNVAIHLERSATAPKPFNLDSERAQALEAAFTQLSNLINRPIQPEAQDFLRIPGLLSFEDSGLDPDEALEAISPALDGALERLLEMRQSEGQDLKSDLLERLDIIEEHAKVIAEANPQVVIRQRENLHQRLRDAEIELDLNDERLLKEIAIFAERCDISEETTRLSSHIGRFREYLDRDESVGRPLDFLCQELNREFNTIGSKANDSGIAQNVVMAKTELEKIREQVQNIE
ncbi:YicC/YloC family endoribonuclease [Verrucomicrobiaceae bacterium 227]